MKEKISKILILLLPLFPILITFWIYKPVLTAHFNWEDTMLLGDGAKTLTAGNIKYIFCPWGGGYARLFWQWISVVNFYLFGYNATPFFVLILFFHLANVLLTYLLAIKLTKSKFIAFFSSFLYGVYQINSSSIVWISSGTKDLPMTTFFLLSLLFFIFYREHGKKILLFGSYLAFAFSFASEFKAIASPFLLLAYEVIFYCKKNKSIKRKIIEFFPFLLIIFLLSITFYSGVFKMISSYRDWSFWQTFIAGLPLYLLPISKIFWLRVYTDAHGLTSGQSDELFLKEFGWIIFISIAIFCLVSLVKKERGKIKLIFFFLSGILINFFPVMLTVFSKHHTLWAVVTVHWRYFLIVSPLGAILLASAVTWTNDLIYNLIKTVRKKLSLSCFLLRARVCPFLFLGLLVYLFVSSDQELLQKNFLNWTYLSKNNFMIIKQTYPVLSKETVFVVEGTDNETRFPFFQHRYLFENVFALFANPNNPNYLIEQKNMAFNPNEGSDRTLKRLLYYTNIKDFLVGYHRHLYKEGSEITFISPTTPWGFSAHDRLFLGAIYGYYDPEKIIDFMFLENGSVVNVTEERKKEVNAFLHYFCFDKGVKKCYSKPIKLIKDPLVEKTFDSFSETGKRIVEFLIKTPPGKVPEIEEVKIPSNL